MITLRAKIQNKRNNANETARLNSFQLLVFSFKQYILVHKQAIKKVLFEINNIRYGNEISFKHHDLL